MLLVGCEAPSFDVSVVGEMVQLVGGVAPSVDAQLFNPNTGEIMLSAAGNETVSFQLLITAGPFGTDAVQMSFDPSPRGTRSSVWKIGKSNVRAFRMLPMKVTDYPSWYLPIAEHPPHEAILYDALVPLDAGGAGYPLTRKLAPGETLAVWVDLRVPLDAPPGEHRRGVTVSCADPMVKWTAQLVLTVHDFALPGSGPVAAIGSFDHTTLFAALVRRDGEAYVPVHLDRSDPQVRGGLTIMREMMRMAREHRLDLLERSIRPLIKRDELGKVQLQWPDYDAIVRPYLSGSAYDDGAGCRAWPLPLSEHWPDPVDYGGANSPEYRNIVESVLRQTNEHLVFELGYGEQLFGWPYRRQLGAGGYERFAQLAGAIRQWDPDSPIFCALGTDPPADITSTIDMLTPPGRQLDPNTRSSGPRREHPLTGVWLRPGVRPYVPSLSPLASPVDIRALPWIALKYNCKGLFLSEVLNWPLRSEDTISGAETRLFYPGTIASVRGVLPSVRLKRLRRGLGDIAYLHLLRRRGRAPTAESLINALVRYAGRAAIAGASSTSTSPPTSPYVRPDGWVHQASPWADARRIMAAEISQAIHRDPNADTHSLRVMWELFNERTHTVRLERARCTVRPEGADDTVRATVSLDLFNEYDHDVDVLVRIGQLPEGWSAPAGEICLHPLEARGSRTVKLTTVGPTTAAAGDGKIPIPLSITVEGFPTAPADMSRSTVTTAKASAPENADTKRREMLVAVPIVRAAWTDEPPEIDGSLNDWPMRVGNTAGGFKLIGRRGRIGTGLASRQTVVFLQCDARNLYIAFRCNEPNIDGLIARADNRLRRRWVISDGEDMVEIVLAGPAGAPGGPYHIAVKSNGVMIAERGAPTSQPFGPARPWPASIAVAVNRQPDAWVVEMAIPFAAFGAPSATGEQQFWPVNFARFATGGVEASTWAPGATYWGDVGPGGTMFIPPIKSLSE